jgi:hypothetical protein
LVEFEVGFEEQVGDVVEGPFAGFVEGVSRAERLTSALELDKAVESG